MSPPRAASDYRPISIIGTKIMVQYTSGDRGNIIVSLLIKNTGGKTFRNGRLVIWDAPYEQREEKVWLWGHSRVKKEMVILRNVEIPRRIDSIDLKLLFYDGGLRRGKNRGGRVFDVPFDGCEIEVVS